MQETKNKTALIWFRNDLRVNENVVLDEALKNDNNVIAVYFFDPRHFEPTRYGFNKTEKFRAKFLIETITDLKHKLSKLNITLLTYRKKPESVIPRLIKDIHIDEIYLQKEWTQEETT
ncbi:MAG: deoxyribodipyrimidine photo-lyase, partial [Aquaticitalea sp.]